MYVYMSILVDMKVYIYLFLTLVAVFLITYTTLIYGHNMIYWKYI